jgi:hypothetical protein
MEILTIPDPKTGRASAWWNEFLVRFFEDQSFDAWVTMHKSPIASVSREELRRNFFAECADDDKSLGEFVERIEVRFLELFLGKTLRSIINSQSNPESTVGA